MINKKLLFIFLLLAVLQACKPAISANDLEGKWLYIKVEYLNQSPKIIQQEEDLKEKSPMIIFVKNGKAQIISGKKIISSGNFSLENEIIRYEEVLPDGIKRKIPFLIKSLEDDILVFESMDQDAIRITAKRVK